MGKENVKFNEVIDLGSQFKKSLMPTLAGLNPRSPAILSVSRHSHYTLACPIEDHTTCSIPGGTNGVSQ